MRLRHLKLHGALYHLTESDAALAEAFRIARPGGRVLLLDLSEHREAWVQNTLGDRWLGFDEDTLRREVQANVRERNQKAQPVNWRFTTQDARRKLARLYPAVST